MDESNLKVFGGIKFANSNYLKRRKLVEQGVLISRPHYLPLLKLVDC